MSKEREGRSEKIGERRERGREGERSWRRVLGKRRERER